MAIQTAGAVHIHWEWMRNVVNLKTIPTYSALAQCYFMHDGGAQWFKLFALIDNYEKLLRCYLIFSSAYK